MQFQWTPERVTELETLVNQGFSASQIAIRLGGGISRNAVIGKVRRNGLFLRGSGKYASWTEREKMAERTREVHSRLRAAKARDRVRKIKVAPPRHIGPLDGDMPEQSLPPSTARMIPLTDLDHGDCRWPFGEGAAIRFCGCKRAEGLPYCDHHAQRAYRSVEAARKAPMAFRRVA